MAGISKSSYDSGYAEKVRDWWVTLTDAYRNKVTELTEEQKKVVRSPSDYSAPFAVDHVLIEFPIAHVAIISRFDVEKDKQITVHGPLKWKDVNSFFDNLIREPRWNRPLAKDLGPPKPEWASKSLAGPLATWLAMGVRNLESYALTEIGKAHFITHTPVTRKCTIMICVGNILEIDPSDYATWGLGEAENLETWNPFANAPWKVKHIGVFTTVFFPPIAVESPPTWKNFESIVYEKFLSSWNDRILNTSFSTFQLAVSRDGTLLVTADDRIIATKAFNTIFAVSALEGLTVFSVKESELGSAKVDAKTLEVETYEPHKGVVFRNMILYDSFYREWGFSKGHRKIISKLQLMRILSRAEKVFENKDIRELLLSWLQAKTLFENSEYSQAFIVSWISVEKDVFKILRDEERKRLPGLASNEIPREYLSFAHALRQLKDSKLLPSDRVDFLKKLNVHRNLFIHQGKEISKEVAYKSLSLLKLVVDDTMDDF